MRRRLIVAGALLAALGIAAAPAQTSQPPLRATLLAFEPDQTIWTIAATQRSLVWESDSANGGSTTLYQRDLRTERQRVLASSVFPQYGLAATREWVVYASGTGSLIAVRHDRTRRHMLAAHLAAPVVGRGERVAWAELDHGTYRVVVQNMATGKQWLAAEFRRCAAGGCFRVDAVTLADRGVVFTRGAIGSQPSFIVRRGFSDPAPTRVAVPRDPQPDLAPSSAGALYYAFERGWYRWDFGSRTPTATRFHTSDQVTVLQYERGSWFTLRAGGCKDSLRIVGADDASSTLASPDDALRQSRLKSSSCAEIVAFHATGTEALVAWKAQQKATDPYPVGLTLVGLVFSQRYRS